MGTKAKLLSLGRKRIPIIDCLRIFKGDNSRTYTELDALQKQGFLKFAKSRVKSRELLVNAALDIWLPEAVVIIGGEKHEKAPKDDTYWHQVIRVKAVRSRDKDSWKRINDWIMDGGDKILVPLNERSLEILSDEKKLAKFDLDAAVLNALSAYIPQEPSAPDFVEESDGPVIVVENLHTFASIAEWNRKNKTYSAVAFGKGMGAAGLDLSWAKKEIHYFGDLDPAGVSIAKNVHSKNPNLSVKPATWAYAFLLEKGIRRQLSAKVPKDTSFLEAWMPELAKDIFTLWRKGYWIPQESLGTKSLLAMGSI